MRDEDILAAARAVRVQTPAVLAEAGVAEPLDALLARADLGEQVTYDMLGLLSADPVVRREFAARLPAGSDTGLPAGSDTGLPAGSDTGPPAEDDTPPPAGSDAPPAAENDSCLPAESGSGGETTTATGRPQPEPWYGGEPDGKGALPGSVGTYSTLPGRGEPSAAILYRCERCGYEYPIFEVGEPVPGSCPLRHGPLRRVG